MSITDLQIMFWFGLALILTGLVLLPLKFSGGGASKIKLPAIEMELNGPALFVMFLGAGLMWVSVSKRESTAPAETPPQAPFTTMTTPAPAPEATRPPPAPPKSSTALTGEKGFGVVLIASSAPSVAVQQAAKAKQLAPDDSDIILYRRKSAWAVVVHYADSQKAAEDLSKYKKEKDWASAYVVNLGSRPANDGAAPARRTAHRGVRLPAEVSRTSALATRSP